MNCIILELWPPLEHTRRDAFTSRLSSMHLRLPLSPSWIWPWLYYSVFWLPLYCFTVLLVYYYVPWFPQYCIAVLLCPLISPLLYYCINMFLDFVTTVLLYYYFNSIFHGFLTILFQYYYCIIMFLDFLTTVLLYYVVPLFPYFCITVLLL